MPANKVRRQYEHEGSIVEAVNVDGYPQHQFAHWKPLPHHKGWPLQVIGAGDDLWCRGCLRKRIDSRILAVEIVTEGEFHFRQNDREYIVPAGHLFLVRPGCTIVMKLHSGQFGRKSVLQITGPLLPSLINLTLLQNTDVFRPQKFDWLLSQHKLAYDALTECQPGYMKVVSTLAYDLIVELGQMASHDVIPHAVLEAINYMEHHCHTVISLEDLSSATKVSQSTLNRLFAQQFGKSPINYFLDMKIQIAKSSLENTSITIKQVALDLGYNNQQYFSTLFRRRVGMTPKEYRRSNRQAF